jgi:hypothetical protein
MDWMMGAIPESGMLRIRKHNHDRCLASGNSSAACFCCAESAGGLGTGFAANCLFKFGDGSGRVN